MKLRCANAAIKEIVQLAVASLNAPEPVVAVLDWLNFYIHTIKKNFYENKFFFR